MPSTTLSLESTGEAVLKEDDNVGYLFVDRNGALALNTESVRKIIGQLVRALNSQHEDATRLRVRVDSSAEAITVLDLTCMDHGKAVKHAQDKVAELEASFGKVAAKLDLFERRLAQDRDTTALEKVIKNTAVQLKEQKESIRVATARMENVDRSVREAVKTMDISIKEMEDTVHRNHETMEEEIETRLREADETVLSLKLDLEACQVSLTDTNKSKATRAEMESMKVSLSKVLESVQKDHATLEEAAGNLGRLEECITMSKENKARCEEISRVFRQEASDLREWASRVNAEVRDKLRDKMERGEAEHRLTDLQRRLMESVSALSQVTARVEQSVGQKASISLVQRLQDSLADIKPTQHSARKLLVSSRCIACDREIPEDFVDSTAIDTYSSKQQSELYQKVQRALVKQGGHEGSADVLRFVAVRVGSPRRVGQFEIRDVADGAAAGLGGHALVPAPPSSRPGGAGGAGLGGPYGPSGGGGGDSSPMPPRSAPREAQPLVRVTPRRPVSTGNSGSPVLASSGTGFFRQDPRVPQGTMKQALGVSK